jgi:hypothetical protein
MPDASPKPDDPLFNAHNAIADEIEIARGAEQIVDALHGVGEIDWLPLQVILHRHVASLMAIRDEIERVPGYSEPVTSGAAPYESRRFLEIGPRIVAQDADRVAVVVPIARERLRELRPLLDALRSF